MIPLMIFCVVLVFSIAAWIFNFAVHTSDWDRLRFQFSPFIFPMGYVSFFIGELERPNDQHKWKYQGQEIIENHLSSVSSISVWDLYLPESMIWRLSISYCMLLQFECPQGGLSQHNETGLQEFPARVFYKMFNILDFQKFEIPKHTMFFAMIWILSWAVWGVLVSPKTNHIGFGSHGHVQKSWNYQNEEFSSSPIMKSESY